jgi:hypothetical protein
LCCFSFFICLFCCLFFFIWLLCCLFFFIWLLCCLSFIWLLCCLSFIWLLCCLSFIWLLCCLFFFFWLLCCLSFFIWLLCCLTFFIWLLCCLPFFFWSLCCLPFFSSQTLNTLWYLQTLQSFLKNCEYLSFGISNSIWSNICLSNNSLHYMVLYNDSYIEIYVHHPQLFNARKTSCHTYMYMLCIMAGRSYLLRNISANLGDIEICSNNESHVSRDHQLRKTLFFDMNVLHIKLG